MTVPKKSNSSYTLITAHFGDTAWISHTLGQVDRLSGHELQAVVVIDQSRSAASSLQRLPRVTDVISLPRNVDQMRLLGHDHPASLNAVVHDYPFTTERIVIVDSDCFPLTEDWLVTESPVRMAQDPMKHGLTHPCFMDFPTSARSHLDFSEGLMEVGIDTGRLAGLQLARAGYSVNMLLAQSAFRGFRGHFYDDGRIYHHGSGSFANHPDRRLSSQLHVGREAVLRSRAFAGKFDLPLTLAARYALESVLHKLRRSPSEVP